MQSAALSPDLCGSHLVGALQGVDCYSEGVELVEALTQQQPERPSPSAAGTGGPPQPEGKGGLQQHEGASLEGANVETESGVAFYQREGPLREGACLPHSPCV